MSESTKELIRYWRQFCSWVIESTPNYVDADFNFDNFIAWLDGLDSEQTIPNP